MSHMIDHPLRQSSANELHARPFPTVAAPARAAFFAYKSSDDETGRDEVADRTHRAACWICMTWRIPMMMQPIFLAN